MPPSTRQQVLTRHHAALSGEGVDTMVFAHGLGCDQTMWRFVAPAFAASHRLLSFDHVGSGRSDRAAYRASRYQSLDPYAEDLLELYAALDLYDTIFVGHSVSAMIGLLAAVQQPERFRQLIMLGPSPRYLNDSGYLGGFTQQDIDELLRMMGVNYAAWAQQMAHAALAHPEQPELAAELASSFLSTDPVILRQFATVTFFSDTRAALPLCHTPTLILQCHQDIVVPEAVGEYLHRTLPHNEYVLMKATGHFPHLSAPEETVEQIRRFITAHRIHG